jgi:D-proline reductase (dithiol) PrdB
MARLSDLPRKKAAQLSRLPCPEFEETPWVQPPPVSECRLAVISTAGIHLPGDTAFHLGSADYRVIPADTDPETLVMSHVSPNFDRAGFEKDINVIFPMDRLREIAIIARELGSLAERHYSFMGATDPRAMAPALRKVIEEMKTDNVTAVLLVPV